MRSRKIWIPVLIACPTIWQLQIIFHFYIGFLAFIPILLLVMLTGFAGTLGLIMSDATLKSKLVIFGCVIATFVLPSSDLSTKLSGRIFLTPKEQGLTQFAQDIIRYGRIKQMSDGDRYIKTLNEYLVEYDTTKVDTTTHDGMKSTLYYITALKKDSISISKYVEFRAKLKEFGFISFEQTGAYVSFTIDGMLDNCRGFAYSESGSSPRVLECGLVVSWTRVYGDWYYWTTT